MKRVFTSPDFITVTQFKEILETAGVPCVIRNENVSGLAGEIPYGETFPEVWVQNDADLPRAEEIKRDWNKPQTGTLGPAWTCPACGEKLEAQFTSCWKCGTPKTPNTALA